MSPEQVAEKLCLAVAARRRRLRLTQKQLAERLGVSRETVSRIENGRRDVKAVVLWARIADALEMNLDSLLHDALRLQSDRHES